MIDSAPNIIPDYLSSNRVKIGALILIYISITSIGAISGGLEWDEGSFFQNAEYFSGDQSNFEESRPAALSYILSIIWQITGESTLAGRILIILFGIATIFTFYKLLSEEFDEPVLPTAVFALSPLMLYWSYHFYTDVPALLFVLLSYYAFTKSRYILSGVFVAVASTFRYLYFLFAIGIAISIIVDNISELRNLIEDLNHYTIGGLIGSTPFFAYSALNFGYPWSKTVMYITRVSKWSSSGPLAATAASFESAVYMLSAMIPGALAGWKEALSIEKYMVLVYTAFMLFVSGNSFYRYWLPVLPFMLIMAYRALDRNVFIALSVIMIVLSAQGVAKTNETKHCRQPLNDSLDYVSTLEGEVVSDRWSLAGYRLDRKVHSTWTSYEQLNKEYGVRYAVVSEQIPYTLLMEYSNDCSTYYVYNLSEPIPPR